MDGNTVLKRRSDLVAADMDGEAVMIDIESGQYFGLTGIGPHLWDALEQPRSVAELIAGVRDAFAVGPDDPVDTDVTKFLRDLRDKKLVEEVAA